MCPILVTSSATTSRPSRLLCDVSSNDEFLYGTFRAARGAGVLRFLTFPLGFGLRQGH